MWEQIGAGRSIETNEIKSNGSRLERGGESRKIQRQTHRGIDGEWEDAGSVHTDACGDRHAVHHKMRRGGGTASRWYIWERDSIDTLTKHNHVDVVQETLCTDT